MKNEFYLFLLSLLFFCSCNGQTPSEKETKKVEAADTNTVTQPAASTNVIDPYFVETESDTLSKSGPTTITRNILQDKKGDFWFATYEGLIHYDGEIFTNFTKKSNDLKARRIFSIMEDKNQNIWFGSIVSGVYKYDGVRFTNFSKNEGLPSVAIEAILEDQTGNIWLGTMNGLSRYDGKKFHNYKTTSKQGRDEIHSIIEDSNGKIWAAALEGVFSFDGQSFVPLLRENEPPFYNVRCIIEDKRGHLWFGGNDGLWTYDGQNFTQILTDFTGTIYEDRKGDLWISSELDGNSGNMTLHRYSSPLFPSQKGVLQMIVKEQDLIFGILEDTEGALWYGTTSGICRYDGMIFDYFK